MGNVNEWGMSMNEECQSMGNVNEGVMRKIKFKYLQGLQSKKLNITKNTSNVWK